MSTAEWILVGVLALIVFAIGIALSASKDYNDPHQ